MTPANLRRYIIEWKAKPTARHSHFWDIFAVDLATAQRYADTHVYQETSGDGIVVNVKELSNAS